MLSKFLDKRKHFWQTYREPLTVIMSILAVSGTLLGLRNIGAIMPLELKSWDYLLRLRPQEEPSDRIMIVEISERDIQQQGVWPWQDRTFAKLIAIIDAGDPVVIGDR
jgi:adenylate cyclase